MDRGRQLEWIQRNRGTRDYVRSIGTLSRQLTGRIEPGDVVVEIAAGIAELVDEEFRCHCRVGAARGATVVIRVDEASLIYAMRLQWRARLGEALLARSTGRRVHRIVFEFGNRGVCIPKPAKGPVRASLPVH